MSIHVYIFATTWENVVSDMCGQRIISLRISAVWSESSLSAWKNFASLAFKIEPSADSHQTAWMRRLIWIVVGRTFPKVLMCRTANRSHCSTWPRTKIVNVELKSSLKCFLPLTKWLGKSTQSIQASYDLLCSPICWEREREREREREIERSADDTFLVIFVVFLPRK